MPKRTNQSNVTYHTICLTQFWKFVRKILNYLRWNIFRKIYHCPGTYFGTPPYDLQSKIATTISNQFAKKLTIMEESSVHTYSRVTGAMLCKKIHMLPNLYKMLKDSLGKVKQVGCLIQLRHSF